VPRRTLRSSAPLFLPPLARTRERGGGEGPPQSSVLSPLSSDMSSTLLLVRHADVGPDYHGRLLGATDVPATAAGLTELERLRPLLREERPAGCLVSPLLRCRQSLAVLAAGLGCSAVSQVEPLLREIDFGGYELHRFEELAAADPGLAARWQRPDFAFPGGESLREFQDRMDELIHLVQDLSPERLLLVTHGGVIRSLLCRLLGMNPTDILSVAPRYGALARIEHLGQGRGVLTGFNL